ncbi:MAG: hypothetical protein GY753_06485, partial [Gammaproteobacteria bacterium]|nr:hypothetical protein [Gammaproteobacteria bacterium]
MKMRLNEKRNAGSQQHGATAFPDTRPKALAVAISLALMPAVGMAGFNNNVELYVIPTTESRTLIGVAGLLPFHQTSSSLLYGDFRLTHSTADTHEFNAVLGRRFLTADSNWILGGHLAYDRRRSRTGRNYNQLGVGFEALGKKYDFRANYYHPTTDKTFLGYGGATYSGNNLTIHKMYEEALRGFDAEVGFNPSLISGMETRFYLGGYHYKGDVADDATGVRLRAELKPRQNMTVGLSFENDDLFGSKGMLEFRYSFGYSDKRARRTLTQRMTEFTRRDIDIRETSGLPLSDAMGDGIDGLEHLGLSDMIHIDNTNPDGAGGDGTAENPYSTIDYCDTGAGPAGCQDADTLVYVHYGDGTDSGMDIGFTMPSGQAIIGEGYNFFGLGGKGLFPMVSNTGGPTIELNDDTEVAGLDISYLDTSAAIYGSGMSNVSIHHNMINAPDGSGIGLESVSGSVSIGHNTIDADDAGLWIDVSSGDTATATIDHNEIDAGEYGIVLETSNSGTELTASVTRNTVTNGGLAMGIYDGAMQDITVANNTFSGEGSEGGKYGDGAQVWVYGWGGDDPSTQTVTLNNNTIAAEGDDAAVLISAQGGEGSTLTQNVNMTGNTISSEGGEAVVAVNYMYDGQTGTNLQNITLTDNTITTSGDSSSLQFLSGAEGLGASTTQDITLTDNDITSEGG